MSDHLEKAIQFLEKEGGDRNIPGKDTSAAHCIAATLERLRQFEAEREAERNTPTGRLQAIADELLQWANESYGRSFEIENRPGVLWITMRDQIGGSTYGQRIAVDVRALTEDLATDHVTRAIEKFRQEREKWRNDPHHKSEIETR